MAGKTAPALGQRFVRGAGRHVFIFVADKTERVARFDQQNRVFRGMGRMTGKAFSFLKGLMLNGAAGLQIGRLVAVFAKLGAFLPGAKGVLGRGPIVAFFTIKLDYRGVRAGF